MTKEEIIKYIRRTNNSEIHGNCNQYKYPVVSDAEILLNVKCYERLLQLTNLSGLQTNEHATILYGMELKKNQIFFSVPDVSRDYKSSRDGVEYGDNQMSEVRQMIDNHPYPNTLVICHIHTHPFNVLKNEDGSPSLQNNFMSCLDINSELQFNKDIKKYTEKRNKETKQNKHVDTMAGLIAIDNENGNSMISFIWCTENKVYRFNNVKVVEQLPNDKLKVIKDLHGDGFDYIERNFGMEK